MVTRLAIMALAAGLVGCQAAAAPPAEPIPAAGPRAMAATARPDPLTPLISFRVFCDMYIVEAPLGSISQQEAVWRRLNEEALSVAETDHLARNGLRVGVGKPADLGELLLVLRQTGKARFDKARLTFDVKSALEVCVTPEVRPQQAFVFSRSGGLSGSDYPAGANLFWVQAWHDIEHMDSVRMAVVPEIRWGRVRERSYIPTLERAEQYRDVGRMFDEVRIDVMLKRGQFLVLAPNPEAEPACVVGRVLLGQPKGGPALEKVLILCPRVVSSPAS